MKRFLGTRISLAAVVGLLIFGVGRAAARGDREDDQFRDAEHKDMKLIGFSDLQNRSTYQPTLHRQGEQGRRYIIYAGHHTLGADAARWYGFRPLSPGDSIKVTEECWYQRGPRCH